MRDAYYLSLAVQAAQSTGELDLEWFTAVAESADDAERRMVQTNADRFMAALRSKRAARR